MSEKNVVKSGSKPEKLSITRGRFALDSANKKIATSKVAKNNNSLGVSIPNELLAPLSILKNIDTLKPTEYRRGRAVNSLGHTIDSSCSLGGKNVMVDTLMVSIINGKPLNTQLILDTLIATKVIGAKKYTRQAMRAKFMAHIKHYDGRGKVTFSPTINVKGADLYALGDFVTTTMKAVL